MIILDFEKSIGEIEQKIEELRSLSEADADGVNFDDEFKRLHAKLDKQIKQVYSKLTPWQKTLVARHHERPHCMDYVKNLITDFTPLAGDRRFAEDEAMIGGVGRFNGQSVIVIGQEKGHDTESRLKHNFGMAKPEGYRKAERLMKMADRFDFPVISFVDTSGAFPGIEAEDRGQAEAIASCIETCLALRVPLISCVIGEGGSGGAIAIASANTVLMLEHSIYSVISPEGCASILWRSASEAKTAAEALNLTAQDLKKLKVIDEIIKEPVGGAHRDPLKAIASAGKVIEKHLKDLVDLDGGVLHARRQEKFIQMGRDLSL
ncbi:MAG: acetyl-CoA carboxylase carboxyltransferase subunit alpha [Alphaproteobacteria bacterium]|nr:acetyl-CoA carboxylase carboxyltransferase subunit alpha [Alphaproteobacteria bacterium]